MKKNLLILLLICSSAICRVPTNDDITLFRSPNELKVYIDFPAENITDALFRVYDVSGNLLEDIQANEKHQTYLSFDYEQNILPIFGILVFNIKDINNKKEDSAVFGFHIPTGNQTMFIPYFNYDII